ncbi:ATP-binding cassette domain-containing protein [candidate division KSB3 bacterium]|uniref:ATP-binding cassette domain-containing protein n=1 Tax=candidate division KSB3 bacterium TaxID=2044937 RepID=A0A9D5JSD2_9BACT|nr:ATP-binding cassette domain-containing protein [candidate division KSB3 bacterium]
MMQEFLQLHNISKSFGGVQALRGVDFSIFPGEIHCLVGENGSGKSTLIKIISGVHQPDSGAIIIEGTKVDHIGSINTIARGIQVIYQDLSLFPNLSVAENIAISEIGEEGRSLIDWREVKRIAQAAMQRIGVEFDLDELVGELPVGRQQLVAICRALTKEVKLLILDEPTASLTQKDIDSLLSVVRDLQAHGIAVLFVSHKLSEVFEVAQRITVLRDGQHVATLPREELTNDKLISLMTGRTIQETRFEYSGETRRKLLEVRGLSKQRNFKDISFELYAGEIIGITGLIGSGRTELALALFGISPADSGEIRVEDAPVQIRSVQDAVNAGIAYVPENRLIEGLILKHSVADNTIAAILKTFRGRLHLLDPQARRDKAEEWIHLLNIQVADPELAVQTLSGGNQQRVVIAKWLAATPKILILDGPTVGIDVMAKSDIHGLIRQLASEGLGVLLISDEVSEVVNNSNRILLMRSGKIHAHLDSTRTTAEEVQHLVEASK